MPRTHKAFKRYCFVDCSPYENAEVPLEFHCVWRFMDAMTLS